MLGNFTSRLADINNDAPNWLRIFLVGIIGLLTIGTLMTDGVPALQKTTVIMGPAVQLRDSLRDGRAV